MPLQATSGAASYDAFGGGVAAVPQYIEDVFSCFLYTGNGTSQTITNNIDLSTKGGLVWIKCRNQIRDNSLTDTARGATYPLISNTTSRGDISDSPNGLTNFGTTGFTVTGQGFNVNNNTETYGSWTFRKQAKFFDIQTWTGTGSNRTISHALGSVPACIIVKRTDTGQAWAVYHRSLANTEYLVLNTTAAKATGATWWNSTTPTSTVFSVGTDASVNASGGTYVAYIFAHDAGGFGALGTDNVISCGSYTTDGSGNASVDLGYEPQWVLIKYNSNDSWRIFDNMRGMSQTNWAELYPNTSDAEVNRTNQTNLFVRPNATGFTTTWSPQAGNTAIYIAIRRGPMKVPTSGTSVFAPVAYSGNNSSTRQLTSGFPIDVIIGGDRNSPPSNVFDRLRGVASASPVSYTASTADEQSSVYGILGMTYLQTGDGTVRYQNSAGTDYIDYFLRRAPSYLDEICYTGTGTSGLVLSHNLTVVPEFTLIKERTNDGISNWAANYNFTSTTYVRDILNRVDSVPAVDNYGSGGNNYAAAPTATTITVGAGLTNANGSTYVAYLFATCAGVSKVGNFTGNGSTQTINCGFGAGGARFVLIKRTDNTGNWYVYDTARGMTVLTNPYLRFNSTSAEVATLGSVTTVSTGFALNAAVLADININAATYIFLAIA